MSQFLYTSVEYLKTVGSSRAEVLKKELGIFRFGDLLTHYPFRYIDKSKYYKINELMPDMPFIQLKGKITKVESVGFKTATRLVAKFRDDTGVIDLVWFKGIKWVKQAIEIGEEIVLYGKPTLYRTQFNITHPELEKVSEREEGINGQLAPVYHTTEKASARHLDSKGIGKLIKLVLSEMKNDFEENLSTEIVGSLKLIDKNTAIKNIHFPANVDLLRKAIFRLKFEELFFVQLELLKMKVTHNQEIKGFVFHKVGENFNRFYSSFLPFQLTNAQKRVVKEIRNDLGSGRHMNRLLQGDVGSGKTIVSVLAILLALDNEVQACLMAPTEILASQHFEGVSELLSPMGINVGILTGSTKVKQRRIIHEQLLSGEMNIIIGTHALLEDKVQFKKLGLAVIDEQHRFGVAQRAKLWNKNKGKGISPPHILVMTATPIPRTLAMTFYGDLDVSIIDELPPGRKPIKTLHKFDASRLAVWGFLKEEIKKGRQIYIVYPLIQESEKMDYKDLEDGYESVCRDFPNNQISIVHGKMKAKDKAIEMQRFINKETQIMVATTVIEVGVNVPNASVMVIESAERFGLSQLHQLRGRVGRGAEQSFCILMTSYKLSANSKTRMQTMVATNDGFEIAEVDLRLRGPGDLVGTQQSGILDLKLADIAKDGKLLQLARDAASQVLKEDPNLALSKNAPLLKQHLQSLKGKMNWARIS